MTDAKRLAGLIASRICHDLISPVGAMGNGMELLQSPGSGREEIRLVADCAETASNALQFLRIAFGARDSREAADMKEVRAVTSGYFERRRITLNWEHAPETAPYGAVQPMLLLLFAGAQALPRGGEMALAHMEAEPLRIEWRLVAERIKLQDRALELLESDPALEGIAPGEVHFPLLRLMAGAGGAKPYWREEGAVGVA